MHRGWCLNSASRRKRSLARVLIVAAILALLLAEGGPAAAATKSPPYDDQFVQERVQADLTGHGTATATKSVNPSTGATSVSTTASDDLPAGISYYGVTVGSSSVLASGYVKHSLAVAGLGNISAVINNLSVNVGATCEGCSLSGLQGAVSAVYAYDYANFFGPGGMEDYRGWDDAAVLLAYNNTNLGVASVTVGDCSGGPANCLSVPSGVTTAVIYSGIYAYSAVNGPGEAHASGSGTVASLATP